MLFSSSVYWNRRSLQDFGTPCEQSASMSAYMFQYKNTDSVKDRYKKWYEQQSFYMQMTKHENHIANVLVFVITC